MMGRMPSPPTTTLIDALRAADRAALEDVLSEDVSFHSPVTDYQGRDEVVNLIATIGTVVEDVRVRRELRQDRETATFIEAAVGGRAVDGVLDQFHDESGRVCEITLMLRPLEALLEGVKRMRTALGLDT
jgi:hypothetical protein